MTGEVHRAEVALGSVMERGDPASPGLGTLGKSLSFSRPILSSAKFQLQTVGSMEPGED